MSNPTTLGITLCTDKLTMPEIEEKFAEMIKRYEGYCNRQGLPELSASELLSQLYAEVPRRQELCSWVQDFLDEWEALEDIEQRLIFLTA